MLSTLNNYLDENGAIKNASSWKVRHHRISSVNATPEERNWIGAQFVEEGRTARSIIDEVSSAKGTVGAITKQYVAPAAKIYAEKKFFHERGGKTPKY